MRRPFSASARRRRGSILPIVAVSFVALCGFAALAVDVGMIAVAKTQIQNAADSAALSAARTFDGSGDSSLLSSATQNANNAGTVNKVLGKSVTSSQITLRHGAYHYDPSAQKFVPQYPAVAPDNYNLTEATVNHSAQSAFASVLGLTSFPITATAVAAHRPRDVAVVLDFSGSMNDESDLWLCQGYFGSLNNTPNNTDTVYPRFGHYSSSSANLLCTSTDPRAGKCNITIAVDGMTPLVNDFYAHARGASTSAAAFSSAGYDSDYYASSNPGDRYLKSNKNTGSSYAKTVKDLRGSSSTSFWWEWELDGYSQYNGDLTTATDYDDAPFNGYTQGPGYWGKTFYVWPPDPRNGPITSSTRVRNFLLDFDDDDTSINWDSNNNGTLDTSAQRRVHDDWPWPSAADLSDHLTKATADGGLGLSTSNKTYRRIMRLHNRPVCDWRDRFFGTTDNTKLWSSSGTWRNPSGYYTINYAAILAWIKSGPNPFPTQLRAGRVLYYDAIPDDVPASAYNHSNLNANISDVNQRFWKEYIDYVLGVWRSPHNSICAPSDEACSYGPDFSWGTIDISSPPSSSNGRYMDYLDNPKRPRHRFWFGPMTMVQFMADTKLLPGNAHDVSMYSMKLGVAGAVQNILNNHPNDQVALVPFSRPQFSGDPDDVGAFDQALVPLGRDYAATIERLWFPKNSDSSDVRPWDDNDATTPRSNSDFNSNTTTIHGMMIAYNQLSGRSDLRTSGAGGWGRKGAQRVVILETDGMANVNSIPSGGFSNNGAELSYYKVRPGDSFSSGSYSESAILKVAQAICNKPDGSPGNSPGYSGNPGYPGYSLGRKPAQIHTLAFGTIFEPSTSSSYRDNAVDLLQQIATIGGTTFPSSSSDPDNGYKWCVGTLAERKDKLRQAFTKIMDDGVSVSLIQ